MAGTPLNPVGRETLTVATVAVALTVPARARHALMTLSDGSGTIRWNASGTDPTTTAGHQLLAGDVMDLTEPLRDYRAFLLAFKAIREGATSGTLEVTYYD